MGARITFLFWIVYIASNSNKNRREFRALRDFCKNFLSKVKKVVFDFGSKNSVGEKTKAFPYR